jgi:hypothetical protein
LALIKFLDLIEFKIIFNFGYNAPTRQPKLGHYRMVVGLLILRFIGFNRIWHFTYIRLDAMLCGFFRLQRFPVATTFYRYDDNMGFIKVALPQKRKIRSSAKLFNCPRGQRSDRGNHLIY